ncbi:hypothetical protein ONE63_008106 [Megalurothrips usitatus]|uniref:Uncharacterized protein n=1 Tax=Megalurothrips usitatus TaxID=439358 RepID=A0AAV7XNH0_9NEOP|nr:hypothetical protein ONE63_008106 [Megalurothrips usitatus]
MVAQSSSCCFVPDVATSNRNVSWTHHAGPSQTFTTQQVQSHSHLYRFCPDVATSEDGRWNERAGLSQTFASPGVYACARPEFFSRDVYTSRGHSCSQRAGLSHTSQEMTSHSDRRCFSPNVPVLQGGTWSLRAGQCQTLSAHQVQSHKHLYRFSPDVATSAVGSCIEHAGPSQPVASPGVLAHERPEHRQLCSPGVALPHSVTVSKRAVPTGTTTSQPMAPQSHPPQSSSRDVATPTHNDTWSEHAGPSQPFASPGVLAHERPEHPQRCSPGVSLPHAVTTSEGVAADSRPQGCKPDMALPHSVTASKHAVPTKTSAEDIVDLIDPDDSGDSDDSNNNNENIVVLEGDSSNCGAIYLPKKSKASDVPVIDPQPPAKAAGKRHTRKVSKDVLKKLTAKAKEHFEREHTEGRTRAQKKTDRSVPAKRGKKVLQKGAQGLADEDPSVRVSERLADAYRQCGKKYQDEEEQYLRDHGVLLPNGYTPMPPFQSEEGESFMSMSQD